MCVNRFLMGASLLSLLSTTFSEQQLSYPEFISSNPSNLKCSDSFNRSVETNTINTNETNGESRNRREISNPAKIKDDKNKSIFNDDDLGWSIINEEVDMVIPMVLAHVQKLGVEYLQLPDMKESITLRPLFITYEAGLFLTNGIAFNIAGIKRHNDAYMTYEGKSFLSRFYLKINTLQFEYNFLLKLMALEGYGKVIGSLDDTVVYAELAVNVSNTTLHLNDFRIIDFRNINVQLDQMRLIRQITGAILSPITNLFRNRITTSISDGLKEQMQTVMDDFNNNDPLELRKFTMKMISSLTGQTEISIIP